jgi:transposase
LTSQDKREAPEEYQAAVEKICDTYRDAAKLAAAGTHVVSTDEKTGMQALERLHETKPVRPGLVERVEFEYIRRTIDTAPDVAWIFVADQLDTHRSAQLVELIARRCGIKEDLGAKGKKGILKSKKTRKKFLEDPSHRIRFVYTPRHCSWLNQVEIWFSILARRLLKRSSFTSVEDLKARGLQFIEYFNNVLAKPFRWTYSGRPLTA